MHYSDGFKTRMIERMAGAEGISATALSREIGITQPTLSRWLRQARRLPDMAGKKKTSKKAARSPRQWTAQDKLRVVMEASQLSDEQLGEFLRREGLHAAQLERWRGSVLEASTEALRGSKKGKGAKASSETKKIKALERELRRKDKALAEVTALLALQKKLRELWGDEDGDTSTRNGR